MPSSSNVAIYEVGSTWAKLTQLKLSPLQKMEPENATEECPSGYVAVSLHLHQHVPMVFGDFLQTVSGFKANNGILSVQNQNKSLNHHYNHQSSQLLLLRYPYFSSKRSNSPIRRYSSPMEPENELDRRHGS